MTTSSIKKNLQWNLILTISGYLFPLLTFPYITRVLGAENFGVGNYILGIIDYAILFSSFGIASIGSRYIAQCNDIIDKRNHVFNSLVSLHIIMSIIVLAIYITIIFLVPQLHEHKHLYFVGASKILFNVFLVEWLFQGLQDFRYIAIRSIIIRFAYVISIFLFIHSPEDYDWYIYITIGQVFLNSVVNWHYTKGFVQFHFRTKGLREFVFPVFSMGVNRILLSFYSTFNIIFLGSVCSSLAVGYFTTATKLYGIFIGLISAFNGVMIPHLNGLIGQGNYTEFKHKVSLSFSMVSSISIPFTIVAVILAPEIIRLIAGEGYESAILPFQIISVQIILVGFAQITENQILLSLKKFREVLFCTLFSTSLSVCILYFLAKQYAEIAGALAVAIPHFVECVLLLYFAKKSLEFKFPSKEICMSAIITIPIAIFCLLVKSHINNNMLILIISFGISAIYYLVMQYYAIKNEVFINQINNILHKNNSSI